MSAELTALQSLALDYNSGIYRLMPNDVAVLFYASSYLEDRFNWVDKSDPLDVVTDSDWDTIEAMVASALRTLKMPILGMIVPFVTEDPASGVLPCDGSVYLRVDFPDLYAVLDPFFIVDADHFNVPDLRGRVVLGVGSGAGLSNYNVGDNGGEEAHTLTTGEIASHTHSQSNPTIIDPTHSHVETGAVPTLITIGAGVPAPSAIPSPTVTAPSLTGITALAGAIANTGGDGAHENRQPYYSLNYGIVAQ